jgi:pimeloyl-ACP methyl ester carboxylesterase
VVILLAVLALTGFTPAANGSSNDTPRQRSSVVQGSTEFRSGYVSTNGVRLHYVRGGTGPAIVLLHGWPQTWYQWRRVMPELARNHTVVAVDMRGFGNSSKPASGYDFRTVATDISGLITQLGLGRVHVVGHDMGAVAAYRLAADHRDQVQTLTYMDEPLPGFSYEELASGFSFGAPGFWFAWFNRLPGDFTQDLVRGDERRFLTFIYEQLAPNHEQVLGRDAVREYVRQYSKRGAIASSTGMYRDVHISAAQNRESAADKLTIPVLAIGAEFGLGTIPEQDMRAVAQDVRAVVIPGSSHFISEHKPRELVTELLRFYEATSTPAGG